MNHKPNNSALPPSPGPRITLPKPAPYDAWGTPLRRSRLVTVCVSEGPGLLVAQAVGE